MRSVLKTWNAVLLYLATFVLFVSSQVFAELPNLLVITMDTTRADRLGSYGFEGVKTPNIDRLAAEGIRFERAYAQSPQTLPSHITIFTGLYPITHNVLSNGQRLSDDATTLAEILEGFGYQTAAFVGASPLHSYFNLSQGFKRYGDNLDESSVRNGFRAFWRKVTWGKMSIPAERSADAVVARASRWLSRRAKKSAPFFLWVHFYDPHFPYETHPDFGRPELKGVDLPANDYGELEGNYLNEIEFVDHYLGKLMESLKSEGVEENTVTVLTADHGESLGEHGYRGHRQELFEQIIRVPLIFHYPGRLSPTVIDRPVMTIDITPTILKLLDLPYPLSGFQGLDLFRPDQPVDRKVYSMAVKLFTKSPIRRVVISKNLKFLQTDQADNMLFDLKLDPGETRNLLKLEQPQAASLDWEQELDHWFERFEALEVTDYQLPEQHLEQLRSLGYVN